jgi:CBS domain-containing protein
LSNVLIGSISRIPVPTATPSTTVTKLASIMAKQNIGAVIVTLDFEVIGIVTERDIISRVISANRELHDVVAQDIMTTPVITIDFDRTLADALKIMKDNNVRRLVVVKKGKIFGLVTERRVLIAGFAGKQNAKLQM